MKNKILLGLLAMSIPFFTFTSCDDDDDELNSTNKNAEITGHVYSLGNCVLTLSDNNLCELDSIKKISSTSGTVYSEKTTGTFFYSGSDLVLKTRYMNVDSTYKDNMTMYSKVATNNGVMTLTPYYSLDVTKTDTAVILSCGGATLYLKGITNLDADAQGFYTMDFTASSFWNHDIAASSVNHPTITVKNTYKKVQAKDSTLVDTMIVTYTNRLVDGKVISRDTTTTSTAHWEYSEKTIDGDLISSETTKTPNYMLESVGAFAYQVDSNTGKAQLILNDNQQTYNFTIIKSSDGYYLYGQPVEMKKIR